MKHIIIYIAIALVMFGLLGWYFAQQEDLQPKALQAELSVSNVAKLPQQKVEMLFRHEQRGEEFLPDSDTKRVGRRGGCGSP
jgi:hypothetical protein